MISKEVRDMEYRVVGGYGRRAIFDKDGNRISDFFDEIYSDGLLKGESDYYIASRDRKDAIFDKEGRQISQWFKFIHHSGLVEGKCDYYIACDKGSCAVYHKNGQKVSEDFSTSYLEMAMEGNVIFNDNLGIVELFNENGNLVKTIDFKPVSFNKEEFLDYTKLLNI
jgi:antitoxin component YwqK of YwqJK toxin-antitoxin module